MQEEKLKSENKIELIDISKSFLSGQIIANDKISISFKNGEIHSIVGENGSGKSTLMSILFGLYNLDSGQIKIDDQEVNMYEQGSASKHKIGMVHQHFHLVENFTVLENIVLGQEKKYLKAGSFIDRKKIKDHFNEISEKYNIFLDPDILVKKLNIGDRQKVEILKTLWEKKDVVIFDEPTATLSVKEVELLLNIIKDLKTQNILIIFVSHKLQEVKFISDRVTVLKRGKIVGTYENNNDLTVSKISKLMIGREINIKFNAPVAKDNVILKVENLNYITSRGFHAVRNVSFEVKEDEIFGLAGIEGNGQEEILNVIAGIKMPAKNSKILFFDKENALEKEKIKKYAKRPKTLKEKLRKESKKDEDLEVKITGKEILKEDEVISSKNNEESNDEGFVDITYLPIKYKQKFMSHVPIDRFEHGVLLNKSIKYNSIISDYGGEQFSRVYNKKFDKSFIMNDKKINEWSNEIVQTYNVEGVKNVNQLIRNLSGGNQQKFVFGREISNKHSLLLAGNPTRGLDINAVNNIYEHVIRNAKSKATILYSLELSELIEVCTRIAILYKGQIIKIIEPKKYNFETISKMLVGETNE